MEPPPEIGRRPTLGRRDDGAGQVVDANPVVEALRTHAVEPHELQHAFEVGDDDEEQGRGDAGDDGKIAACLVHARYIHAYHVEDDAEDAHRRHRGDERHGEVVGDVGLDGGNLAEGAHHPVAEVVVADRLAAQPGVFGVSDLRVDGGAEEGEVHRLLGVVDEGVVGAEERPADEEDEEYCFCDDDGAPLALDEVAEVVEVAVRDVGGQRGHEQHEGDCDGLHGGDVGESEYPEEV